MNTQENQLKEPKLEDFGLSPTFYDDYAIQKAQIETELESLKASTRDIEDDKVIKFFRYFFGFMAFSQYFVLLYFISNPLHRYAVLALIGLILCAFLASSESTLSLKNIVSFGKFRRLQKQLENKHGELQTLRSNNTELAKAFEEKSSRFYLSELEEFYQAHLYRKKSGSSEFEAALVEFANMIETFSETNKLFLTVDATHNFEKYRLYLGSRFYDHKYQESKPKGHFPVAEHLIQQSKNLARNKRAVPSPQEKFRIPRKIDWNDVQSNRRTTGIEGEEVAMAIEKKYLISIGRPDLAERVVNVSKEQGDGLGYDIVSCFPDGREKFIEVKSTTGKIESPYFMSVNELRFLRENLETYFLYRVALVIGNVEASSLEIIAANDVLSKYDIVPSLFKVGLKKETSA